MTYYVRFSNGLTRNCSISPWIIFALMSALNLSITNVLGFCSPFFSALRLSDKPNCLPSIYAVSITSSSIGVWPMIVAVKTIFLMYRYASCLAVCKSLSIFVLFLYQGLLHQKKERSIYVVKSCIVPDSNKQRNVILQGILSDDKANYQDNTEDPEVEVVTTTTTLLCAGIVYIKAFTREE